jgi:hypothetical protein
VTRYDEQRVSDTVDADGAAFDQVRVPGDRFITKRRIARARGVDDLHAQSVPGG